MTTTTDTTPAATETPATETPATETPKTPRKGKGNTKAKGKGKARKAKASKDESHPDKRASVVPNKYKARYAKTHDSNGDDLAEAMRAATTDEHGDTDIDAILRIGKQNGIDAAKRWGHLRNRDGSVNVGMIRMNLGNCLRGLHRQGQDIKIGSKTIKGVKQPQAESKAKKAA